MSNSSPLGQENSNQASGEVLERATEKLYSNLEDLMNLYRHLLTAVRKEKDLLLEAKHDELNENNLQKEQLLQKIRLADTLRQKHAQELAQRIGADVENPRLMEIAQKLPSNWGDRMRQMHSGLDILIRRLTDLNRENENFAKTALNQLDGAMNNVKDTLSGKKTYERKGQYKIGPEHSGNFVKKEM